MYVIRNNSLNFKAEKKDYQTSTYYKNTHSSPYTYKLLVNKCDIDKNKLSLVVEFFYLWQNPSQKLQLKLKKLHFNILIF